MKWWGKLLDMFQTYCSIGGVGCHGGWRVYSVFIGSTWVGRYRLGRAASRRCIEVPRVSGPRESPGRRTVPIAIMLASFGKRRYA